MGAAAGFAWGGVGRLPPGDRALPSHEPARGRGWCWVRSDSWATPRSGNGASAGRRSRNSDASHRPRLDQAALPPAASHRARPRRTRKSSIRRSRQSSSGPSWCASRSGARNRTRRPTPPRNPFRWPGRPPRPDLLKKPAKPGAPAGARRLEAPLAATADAPRPSTGSRQAGARGAPQGPRGRLSSNTGCGARWTVSSRGRWSRRSSSGWARGETLKKIRNRHEEICMALRAPAIRGGAGEGQGRGGDRSAERVALGRRPPGDPRVVRLPGRDRRPSRRDRPARGRTAPGQGPRRDAAPAHRRGHRRGQSRSSSTPCSVPCCRAARRTSCA